MYRRLSLELNHPIQLSFSVVPSITPFFSLRTQHSFVSALPPNIHLQTLAVLPDGLLLLRLHHLFAQGEDEEWAVPVTVDIRALFPNKTTLIVAETQLTGVVVLDTNPSPIVTLQPMQFRTFLIRLL
jgi:hypothetical protein